MEPTTRNCSTCRKRPRKDGGQGNCPQTGTLLAIFLERGKDGADNECWAYDPRPFTPQKVIEERSRHPQEASLF